MESSDEFLNEYEDNTNIDESEEYSSFQSHRNKKIKMNKIKAPNPVLKKIKDNNIYEFKRETSLLIKEEKKKTS